MKSRLDLKVSDIGTHDAEKHRRTGARLLGRGRQARRAGEAEAGIAEAAHAGAGGARGDPGRCGGAAALVLDGGQTHGECRVVDAGGPFGVPTVAILPFANVTGDPQYDTVTQRIGRR